MTNQDAKQSGRTGSTTVIAIVPAVIAALGAILAAWITAAAAMPQVVVVTQPAPLPPAPIGTRPGSHCCAAGAAAGPAGRRAASVPEADAGYAASADPRRRPGSAGQGTVTHAGRAAGRSGAAASAACSFGR